MANKKRIATSVAAVATAAALLLGGTFAWQSANQTALNEASDVINPGGRLHDDFNGENKDIYVENFADEPIYARVQLSEYFEIIANYGKGEAEKSTPILGSKNDDDTYNYALFDFNGRVEGDGTVLAGGSDEEGNPYWTWKSGGSTVYMPTFNMNKDSLAADVNGIYEEGNVGTISNRFDPVDPQYSEYTDWAEFVGENGTVGEGATKSGTEIYDGDANNIDDDDIREVANVEHTAQLTEDGELISMADWDGAAGPYWVYDTDGWVYWAQPIQPHTATGLLLDSIRLNQVMDDTWYYAIQVVAQFVTAEDVGKADGTGFYVAGTEPTAEAEELLWTIGVTSVDDTPGGGSGDPVVPESPLQLTLTAAPNWYIPSTSMPTEISLSAAAAYEDSSIGDVSGVVWSISGHREDDTALSAETGGNVTLNIAPYEEGNIIVAATFTYVDDEQGINETVTEEIVVTNGPSVGTFWMYDNQTDEFVSHAPYTSGEAAELSFTTYFFPKYTGTIQPKEDAYSGEEADLLAQKYTYSLVVSDTEDTPTTIEGVTLSQDGADLTVSIAETVDQMIYIKCSLQDSMQMLFELYPQEPAAVPAPTVAMEMQGYIPKVIISDIDDEDFPLTLKAYERTGGETDEEATFADTPYRTVVFSLSESEVTADSDLMYRPTYADGSLTATYDVLNDGMPYYDEIGEGRTKFYGLKLVVTDAAGNASEEAKISWITAEGCFVAGTQVQTVQGLVNIEDIKVGDQVYSLDLTTDEQVVSTVAWVQGTRYIDATYTIYAGGEKVVTTYEHPFYVMGKEWVAAEDLVVGDVIKTVDGELTITDIVYTELDAPVQVYNFTVEGTHNYLISESGLLVHNITK
ncbi:MAG: hypothetical protein IJA33_02815 [Oscillospiraceae bacterium]|nr:hypothetical protein [Oscillospiraceae bacterium]